MMVTKARRNALVVAVEALEQHLKELEGQARPTMSLQARKEFALLIGELKSQIPPKVPRGPHAKRPVDTQIPQWAPLQFRAFSAGSSPSASYG